MRLKDATILIVDDEDGLRLLLTRWFEREGCRVLAAANGAEAFALATANEIHMVVSDIRMPVMDGIELARRLKAHGKYFPKVIFISGFGDIDEREALDLGVEGKLSKPIGRAALAAVVRHSLLEREACWRDMPADVPARTLYAVFPGLTAARRQGLIAFGRGGFCIRSGLRAQADTPIGLRLEFDAEGQALIGQGIVRWAEPREAQIGVEIAYIEDAHRAWVAELAERNESMSFIPRTCDPEFA
jgi:CheY-like chemotaxis protein